MYKDFILRLLNGHLLTKGKRPSLAFIYFKDKLVENTEQTKRSYVSK